MMAVPSAGDGLRRGTGEELVLAAYRNARGHADDAPADESRRALAPSAERTARGPAPYACEYAEPVAVWHGVVWRGMVCGWLGLAWLGLVVWRGLPWLGLACHCATWRGLACLAWFEGRMERVVSSTYLGALPPPREASATSVDQAGGSCFIFCTV
jgi:hypothetical protein